MMDNINLLGTEDVLRASRNIQQAATDMYIAHSYLKQSLSVQRQFMDDWLNRLESILEQYFKDKGE